MRKIISGCCVIGLSILCACGGGYGGSKGGGTYTTPTDPGTNASCPASTICMGSASFSPASLTVSKGTTVTFNNNSTVDHNVVFDAPAPTGVADVGAIAYGSTTSRTFASAGTFNFHCTIHAGMTGTLVVQ